MKAGNKDKMEKKRKKKKIKVVAYLPPATTLIFRNLETLNTCVLLKNTDHLTAHFKSKDIVRD